jgi:hypothetical protein
MTGKKIGSSAVSFKGHSKSSGSSKGHSGILSKIDTAIKGAEVAVDAVNAGVNVANAVKQPAPAPARREFDDFELYIREPVKSKSSARKSSGRKHSSTLSKINTAINGAQVAVDAVNAGADVANAANQPAARREFDDSELYVREPVKSKGGARKSSGGRHSNILSKINTAIDGASVAVDAVNAGANVASAVKQRRELDDYLELDAREWALLEELD